MRKERRLLSDHFRHGDEVGDGRVLPQFRELTLSGAIAQLGLVAQGEQRLVAAGRLAGARDCHNFLWRQIATLTAHRRMRERAVVAGVAAQLGQRNEHLARIRDDAAVAPIAQGGGHSHHGVEVFALRQRKTLGVRQSLAVLGACQQRSRRAHGASLSSSAGARASSRSSRWRVGVVARAFMNGAMSCGSSRSRAIAGHSTTVGSVPHCRAVSRWGKKLFAPNRRGTALAGEQRIVFDPSLSRAGTIVNARPERCACSTRRISAEVTRGMSPGSVSMPAPLAARRRAAAATAPVWPSRAPSVQIFAPKRDAMAAAAGSSVITAIPESSDTAATARTTSLNIVSASLRRNSCENCWARRCFANPVSLIGRTAQMSPADVMLSMPPGRSSGSASADIGSSNCAPRQQDYVRDKAESVLRRYDMPLPRRGARPKSREPAPPRPERRAPVDLAIRTSHLCLCILECGLVTGT